MGCKGKDKGKGEGKQAKNGKAAGKGPKGGGWHCGGAHYAKRCPKGAGKGVVGLIVKPVVGISDAATDVFEGIKGSTRALEKGGIASSQAANQQVRPPRAFYGSERAIHAYDLEGVHN